jgi:hypothetical protein
MHITSWRYLPLFLTLLGIALPALALPTNLSARDEVILIAQQPSPQTSKSATPPAAGVGTIGTILNTMKIVGFAQLHFVDEEGANSEFKVHRLRLGVAGKITDPLSYNLVLGAVEPPDRLPHLVNGFVDYAARPGTLNVRAGQFLVPFGLEGPEVITFNPAIERSTASRRLNPYNMFRDVGAQVNGSLGKVGYAVAAINGTGANNSENNDRKNLIGRLSYQVADHLMLGVSGDAGNYISGEQDFDRNRFGVDAEYLRAGMRIRGEFISRDDAQPIGGMQTGRGWYILAAKRLNARWEPVARYEQLGPNRDIADDLLTIITLGVNYYFAGVTRFSVNYEIRDDDANPAVGNLLTAQMQVAL